MKDSTVSSDDEGIRLDRWFSRHYPQVTQVELQKLLRKKLVRVDGKRAESNQRLQTAQLIRHPEFAEGEAKPKPKPPAKPDWLDEAVLYRDKNIIIVNKPSGLPTQGGTGQVTHMDKMLPLLQGDAPQPPKLVHRLDKDTSGVLLLARSAKAADVLMKAFANREIEKTYWAVCVGVPVPLKGEIKVPLAKRVFGGEEMMCIAPDDKEAKHAHSSYRVIEHFARALSLVEMMPHTGRKHQLRVHLAYIDCPILGDGKYAGERAFPEGMQVARKMHLHARRIVIPAECFGKEIDITAPIPKHFENTFDLLGVRYS